MPEAKELREVAVQLVRYFLRNPEAADSLLGLSRWRLLDQRVEETVSSVQQALDWLVEREVLLRDERAGSPAIFRLNKKRLASARQLAGLGTDTAPESD